MDSPLTMSPSVQAEFSAGLRELLQEQGRPLNVSRSDGRWEVNVYGNVDHEAEMHIKGYTPSGAADPCRWVLADGAGITEHALSEFVDTETDNDETVGIEGYPAVCVCGLFTDITLRVSLTLGRAMQLLLHDGDEDQPLFTL